MSQWTKTKLGDIVCFKTGKLDSNAAVDGGKYPFFTCADATYSINTFSFDTECVLLAGNNASGVFPLKYYKGKFDAYQRTYILEPKHTDILDIKYLYFALRPFLRQFELSSNGATTKFLTLGILNSIDFYCPPLPIQCKIAGVLSAYDDLIENNTRRIALLEKMAEEVYREWFVRLRFPGHERVPMHQGVPEGWKIARLDEVVELAYGKALKDECRVEGNFPVIGSSGVVGTHNHYLVEGPGIVVGRKGNVGSVHWTYTNFYPIDTVYYVQSESSLYYLYYLIQTLNFINNDAAVPGLNRSQAYANKFFLPPGSLIEKFEVMAVGIFHQKKTLQSASETLKQTREKLLSRLLSGKIDVENLDIQFPPSMRQAE